MLTSDKWVEQLILTAMVEYGKLKWKLLKEIACYRPINHVCWERPRSKNINSTHLELRS